MSSGQPDARKIPIPLRNVGCQEILLMGEIVHHGHLRKRRVVDKVLSQMKPAKNFFRWKQIYIVLRYGCIYFYDNETAVKARATSLYGFTSVETCENEVGKEVLWPFKLVCALEERDKDYFFSAASEKDLKNWMKHIQDQINYANGFPPTKSPLGLVHPMQMTESSTQGKSVQRPLPTIPVRNLSAELKDNLEVIYMTDSSSDDEKAVSTKKPQAGKSKVQLPSNDDVGADCAEEKKQKKPIGKTLSSAGPTGPTPNSKTAKVGPAVVAKVAKIPPEPTAPKPAAKKPAVRPKPTEQSTSATPMAKIVHQDSSASESITDDIIYEGSDDYYLSASESAALSEISLDSAVSDATWDREPEEADEIMRSLGVSGAYMIRESMDKSSKTLMVCLSKVSVKKYRIFSSNNKVSLENSAVGPFFDSLTELIKYYQKNNIPQNEVKLTKPYSTITKSQGH